MLSTFVILFSFFSFMCIRNLRNLVLWTLPMSLTVELGAH